MRRLSFNMPWQLPPVCYLLALLFFSCGEENTADSFSRQPEQSADQAPLSKPGFRADSAYAHIVKQLSFGPRVPGTAAQKQCADWMHQQLQQTCDTVYRQEVTVKGGDGKILPCINLIGSIHPAARKRILLLAHWDSRPWADRDVQNTDQPIMAADDGASGVAVLLELASLLRAQPLHPELGIDILLCDVEDYGRTEWGENSYSLGTQYWAAHPHLPGYKADFGILLDMVGARDARFRLEGYSTDYAPAIQQQVWRAAAKAGYSSYFLYESGGYITDDHYFVNKLTGIPTIDIINLNNNPQSPFAPHWHTHNDDLSIIDKNTLRAVGETLLQVIYETDQTVASTSNEPLK